MFSRHLTGSSRNGDAAALLEALRAAKAYMAEIQHIHFVLLNMVHHDVVSKAVLDVFGEPAEEACSHLYLESRYEAPFAQIADQIEIDYVHVMTSDSLWSVAKSVHPDLALYEAAHDYERDVRESIVAGAMRVEPTHALGPLDKAQLENVFRSRETLRYEHMDAARASAKESLIEFYIRQGVLNEFDRVVHENHIEDQINRRLPSPEGAEPERNIRLEPRQAYSMRLS